MTKIQEKIKKIKFHIKHKINNNFIRKNLTGAKQSSKNNSRIKLKIENDIEVQKIKENNNRKNICIINNSKNKRKQQQKKYMYY